MNGSSQKKKKLGVLEFCCALNSDDLPVIKRALVKFTSQVRAERKLALFNDDYKGEEEEEMDDEEEEEPQIEEQGKVDGELDDSIALPKWARDVKQYNVPFVATSLSFGGDEGFVQRGHWPTGLLHAYLTASPRATELLVSLKQLRQQTSTTNRYDASFQKAYWFAIAELVTAASVSPENSYAHSNVFLQTILDECFPEMCHQIETKYGYNKKKKKRKRDSNPTDKKDDGVTPAILYCFTQLLMVPASANTTTSIARDVYKKIFTSLNSNIFSTMLRLSPKEKEGQRQILQYQKHPQNFYFSSIQPQKLDVSTGCILVTSAMLLLVAQQHEQQQYMLLSSIIRSGAAASSADLGIAYLSFQIGLDHIETCSSLSDNYYFAISQFFIAIRQCCLIEDGATTAKHHHYLQALINKSKSNFFSAHGLARMGKLAAAYTAPMSSFEDDTNNNEQPASPMEIAAVEARKLLLILIGDTVRSPLYLFSKTDHPYLRNNDNPSSLHHSQQQQLSLISKVLFVLTNTTIIEPDMRQFIVKCFQQTPSLVPLYFKAMAPFTSIGNYDSIFSCIGILNNATNLISGSPPIATCWNAQGNDLNLNIYYKNDDSNNNNKIPDSFLMCIYPIHCFNKVIVQKLLSSSISSLVVIETCKLLDAVMQRCEMFFNEEEKCLFIDNRQALVDTLTKRLLPDVPWMLSLLRSKLEAFFSSSSPSSSSLKEDLFFVSAHLCKTLCKYYSILSVTLQNLNNDNSVDMIAKLLAITMAVKPSQQQNLEDSEGSPLFILLQFRILLVIEAAATRQSQREHINDLKMEDKGKLLVKCSSKTFKMFLQIFSSSEHIEIRNLCRNLIVGSLLHLNNYCATNVLGEHEESLMSYEQQSCLLYEANLWPDILLPFVSINEEKEQKQKEIIISCMEKLFETVLRRFMEHFIYAAQAFVDADVNGDELNNEKQQNTSASLLPSYCYFSPFLNFALNGLSEFPEEFFQCVVLVTTKCLLFHEDPTSLALLVILHTSKGDTRNCKNSLAFETLESYSRQIISLGVTGRAKPVSSSSFMSLSTCQTNVLENIFQHNSSDSFHDSCHQALVCKLFTSCHPKVQQQATVAVQDIISRDSSGMVSISVTRQILHHLKLIASSAALCDDQFDFLQKCSYYQHMFTLLRSAIIATSAMNDHFAFDAVVTSIFNNVFFSDIRCSSHLMLICVTLCCLHQTSSIKNGSSFFKANHLSCSMVITQCLERYTTTLYNWILSEQEDSMDCITTFRTHLHFLGALGVDLPNSSRIPLASALMVRANDNLTKTQHCSNPEKTLKWVFKELCSLLQDFLELKQITFNSSADRRLFLFYEQALRLWKNLVSLKNEDNSYSSNLTFRVLMQLEDIIIDSLNHSDHNTVGSSTLLNIAMCSISPVQMFSLSYKSLQRSMFECFDNGAGERKRKSNVFVALLSFSCSKEFLSPLFQFISEEQNNDKFENDVLWESGILDSLFRNIFCEEAKEMLQEMILVYPTAFLFFARRMIHIFRSDAAEHKWRLKLQCAKASEIFLDISRNLKDVELLIISEQIPLRSAMFVFLVEFFPKILRKKPLSSYPDSKSALGANSFISDIVYTAKTVQGIFNSTEAPQCIMQCSAESIAVMVKACLKAGINPDQEWSLLASECLKTVHQLIKACNNISMTDSFLDRGKPLDVARIYEMLLMHSQYKAVMSLVPRRDNAPSAKLELLKLQILCIITAKGSLTMDKSTWDILVQSHNAGVCDEDYFLRQLLHLFIKKNKAANYFMDELLKAGPFASCSLDERWGYIFTLLDHHRLRCTLADFPDWEQSLSKLEVESDDVEIAAPDNVTHDEDDDNSEGSDSESFGDSSRAEFEKDSKSVVLSTLGNQVARQWSGGGPDLRYSPAFVLPLLLGFLEYYLPGKNNHLCLSEGNMTETQITTQGDTFAIMTLRLCDNGGLALALASLSCKCPLLRQIAVAVLLLIMKALTSQEAKMIREWKHRPQVLMLLESVHRGLCLRRRRQTNLQRTNDSSRWIVPMFSTVSAIFLARASIVLCNPSDPMYRAINSYFLRLALNQGAFKDSGNRIPAFVSLYCSTDDSGGHAKRERHWMLFLIRDAVKDRNSFKATIKCHATSLLMGAIDIRGISLPGTNDDTERVAIIQALESMVRHGGELSASHFLCHMGLLSWLHGFLVSRDLNSFLPSLKSRLAFLSLISTTLKAVQRIKGCKWNNPRDTVIEITSLSGSVLELVSITMNQISSCQASLRWDSKTEQRFFALIPICYWDMYLILVNEPSFNGTDKCWANRGISLPSATAVLSKLKEHFEGDKSEESGEGYEHDQPGRLAKFAWSLAFLPFRVEPVPRIKELCLMTISIEVQNNKALRCSSLTCIFQRIAAYTLTEFGRVGAPSIIGDAEILHSVLTCRKFCVGNKASMNAWEKCMTSLLSIPDSSEMSTSSTNALFDAAKLLLSCS